MATKIYSVKSNAKRDMKRAGLPDASTLRKVKGGWTFDGAPEVGGKAAKAKPEKKAKPVKAAKPAKEPTKRDGGKGELVFGMLKGNGASVEELTKATGWLPHTLRSFLSVQGRKRGIAIEHSRKDGVTTYALA